MVFWLLLPSLVHDGNGVVSVVGRRDCNRRRAYDLAITLGSRYSFYGWHMIESDLKVVEGNFRLAAR
jgi:hypothetical protein